MIQHGPSRTEVAGISVISLWCYLCGLRTHVVLPVYSDYSSAVRPSRELQRMFNGVRHHGIFTGFGATSNTPKFTPTEQKIVSEAIFVNCGSMTMLCPDPQNGSRSTLLNASSPSERLKTPWLSFPDGRKQTQQVPRLHTCLVFDCLASESWCNSNLNRSVHDNLVLN